ncbi:MULTISPECIES: hypothetical protein [Halorussus]|uniref:hypothetical protein n=1 Tax=Halorussus TaxID=1070314 RepID=UPI0020A02FF8|nr:hypothetical protein [Halorussus vallis]USZ73832.1 hypothetical protein NGM07_10205 [Halorussus vallis]
MEIRTGASALVRFVLAWLSLVVLLLPAATALLFVPTSLHGYPAIADSTVEATGAVVVLVALLPGAVVVIRGSSLGRLWAFAVVALVSYWVGVRLIDAVAWPSGFGAYPGLLSASVLLVCLLAYLIADFLVYRKVAQSLDVP